MAEGGADADKPATKSDSSLLPPQAIDAGRCRFLVQYQVFCQLGTGLLENGLGPSCIPHPSLKGFETLTTAVDCESGPSQYDHSGLSATVQWFEAVVGLRRCNRPAVTDRLALWLNAGCVILEVHPYALTPAYVEAWGPDRV